jgi:pimeloyl-ACP methyl ester carboxylesterase
MARTHFVLIHGAYHQQWHLHLLKQRLEDAGYGVSAPQLPTAGFNSAGVTLAEDTAVVKEAFESAAATADRIIGVFHSYGGVPGSEGVAELTTATRSKIVRLVYLAAFVIEQGTALYTPTGGRPAPWSRLEGRQVIVPEPYPVFYHDVEPPELAEDAGKHVVPHSYAAFNDITLPRGWTLCPVTYVFCARDVAIPNDRIRTNINRLVERYDLQDRWETFTIDSGHSPFLSQPDECARLLRQVSGEEV